MLSVAGGFAVVLLAAALMGIGSSVSHPEASRVARLTPPAVATDSPSSVFQVAAMPGRRSARSWWRCWMTNPTRRALHRLVAFAAVIGIGILSRVGRLVVATTSGAAAARSGATVGALAPVERNRVFGRGGDPAALNTSPRTSTWRPSRSYYTFFMIDHSGGFSRPRPDLPVPCFWARLAVGHADRRPDRRSDRPQADLVDLDPGRAAAELRCRSSACSGPTSWRLLIGLTMASAFLRPIIV